MLESYSPCEVKGIEEDTNKSDIFITLTTSGVAVTKSNFVISDNQCNIKNVISLQNLGLLNLKIFQITKMTNVMNATLVSPVASLTPLNNITETEPNQLIFIQDKSKLFDKEFKIERIQKLMN